MPIRQVVDNYQFDDPIVYGLYNWSIAYLRMQSPMLVERFHERLARIRIAPNRERALIRPMLMFVLRYTK
jgi:hypothetical protein